MGRWAGGGSQRERLSHLQQVQHLQHASILPLPRSALAENKLSTLLKNRMESLVKFNYDLVEGGAADFEME